MLRALVTLAIASGTGVGGYVVGNVAPAPPAWTDVINRQANDLRAKLRLEEVSLSGLQKLVSPDKYKQITAEVQSLAVAAGDVIEVERDNGSLEDQLDNLAMSQDAAVPEGIEIIDVPASAPSADAVAASKPNSGAPSAADLTTPPPPAIDPTTAAGHASAPETPTTSTTVVIAPAPADPRQVFEAGLNLCPKMMITNPPAHDGLRVTAYHPIVEVKGVKLSTFPVRDACMSSGFGVRQDRLHKGLDFHSDVGVPIFAAGDGTVIEMKFRDDYGNMLLIDHGNGVYTRYAHLASFGRGLGVGVTLRAGEQIGLMGNTASYQVPIHLHYEVLVGDYKNPKGSFGLEAEDPLMFPSAG